MRNILLTGIGGDVACAIVRCLRDGCPEDALYGMDIRRETPYMGSFTKTVVAPPCGSDAYMPFLKRLIEDCGITHILPATEPEILIADRHRAFFAEHGIRLIINHSDILRICTSKYQTAQFLRENDIDAPETIYADAYQGTFGYPFIMKPDFGRGSASLSVIRSETDWKSAQKEGMVCQRMVGDADREYTVGVFSDGARTESIIYRRTLGLGAMSVSVECVDIPEIGRIAKRVAARFGLKGSLNLQLREENGRYYIFEINPRLSSTVGFRHLMGFTDVVWWLNLADGRPWTAAFRTPVGRKGLKVTEDVLLPAGET